MANDKPDDSIRALLKLGCVSSYEWQSYIWKNELAEQKQRVALALHEALADIQTEHDPYHMLEPAIGVAAVCMRRLIEWHLVTDRFRGSDFNVHKINRKSNAKWREPLVSQT